MAGFGSCPLKVDTDAQRAPQSKLPLANSRPIVNLYVSHLTEICGLHYRLSRAAETALVIFVPIYDDLSDQK